MRKFDLIFNVFYTQHVPSKYNTFIDQTVVSNT